MKTFHHFQSRKGFSLPELLIAFVIFSFVAAAAVSGTLLFTRLFASVASTADVQRQERWLEGNLGRDIRMSTVTGLTQPSTNQLRVQRTDNTTILYTLVSNSKGTYDLRRTAGSDERTLISGVHSWSISLPVASSGSRIVTVEWVMEVVRSNGKREPQTFTAVFAPRS